MNFRYTPEEAAFRDEVVGFIKENLPEGWGTPDYPGSKVYPPFGGSAVTAVADEHRDLLQDWKQKLIARRWVVPHWPVEYGGAGMSVMEQFILNQEMARYRAPGVNDGGGSGRFGSTLMIHGTPEQKAEFLPKIANAEIGWCQGWSEPGAGSDLASLQTRAVRDGDEYVINGQKIWTSGAHLADWMFMLARTDPDAPKHRGISMFLFPMNTPGISVSPLPNMSGDHGFNQVFFEDVRVPADSLIGEENRGWYISATLLDFERSNVSGAVSMLNRLDDLVQFAKETKDGSQTRLYDIPSIQLELADRRTEAEIVYLFSLRIISMQKEGLVPNKEASISKVFAAEAGWRLNDTAMKLIGMYGGLHRDSKWAPLMGDIAHTYVSNCFVGAGTNEINRNIIAQRGLGMPRG